VLFVYGNIIRQVVVTNRYHQNPMSYLIYTLLFGLVPLLICAYSALLKVKVPFKRFGQIRYRF
jgi:hypothetical protein